MVWAKLDDEILDNPKIARAGVLGFALHVAAITWCCRNLTDGFVPRGRVGCLLDLSTVAGEYLDAASPSVPAVADRYLDAAHDVGVPSSVKVAEWLVKVGLWRDAPGGWVLHDFLSYNPSKEKVMAERERGRARKAPGTPSGIPPEPRPESGPGSTRIPDGPVPVPVPGERRSERAPDGAPTEPTAEPERSGKNAKRRQRTSCPASDEALPSWLTSWRIPAEDPEVSAFVDHHRAKGNTFADWGAAWRTWVRNGVRFGQRPPHVALREPECPPDGVALDPGLIASLRATSSDDDARARAAGEGA